MSTLTALEQEKQWRRWRDDPIAFYKEAWYIKHPDRGAILPDVREAQIEAFEDFVEHRLVVCLKARQIGWTTIASCFAFWSTYFWPERPAIILSRTEREAQKVLGKIEFAYKRLPNWLLERNPRKTKTLLKMEFLNDSSIECLPSKANAARGESAYLIIVDEWAFLENPEEAWSSIEPAADIGGRIIGLSTANGYGTWFHKFCLDAKFNRSKFHYLFIPWNAVPERDEVWAEEKQRNMTNKGLFQQEYAADDVTCWLTSGTNFFAEIGLPDTEELDDPLVIGSLVPSPKGMKLMFDDEGKLFVYASPLNGRKYVIGADTSGGKDKESGDWSVAQVLDLESGDQVAVWRDRLAPDLFGSVLVDLARYYNNAYLGIERNNHGHTTISTVMNLGYRNIHYERAVVVRQGAFNKPRAPGWNTTETSKKIMYNELLTALRTDDVRVHDVQTVEELRGMQLLPTGKIEGKPHDDCADSLAIAHQMRKFVFFKSEEKDDDAKTGLATWTFDDWMRQAMQAEAVDRTITGGRRANHERIYV